MTGKVVEFKTALKLIEDLLGALTAEAGQRSYAIQMLVDRADKLLQQHGRDIMTPHSWE